jgi:hypothetical protein
MLFTDDLALSLAQAFETANRRARELGVDAVSSIITISQQQEGSKKLWRVNYGPADYVSRRGGDLIIDVDPSDTSIQRVLRGQ